MNIRKNNKMYRRFYYYENEKENQIRSSKLISAVNKTTKLRIMKCIEKLYKNH